MSLHFTLSRIIIFDVMLGVIGDIHGCYYTLESLVRKVREKYSDIPLYSVGDLVDRGNNTCETIEYLLSNGIKFCLGNHDYMFLSYMQNPMSNMGRAWLYNEYEPTLQSYSGETKKMTEHITIIKSAPLYFDLEDCFISHAGISAFYKFGLPENYKKDFTILYEYAARDIEDEKGILWTRGELLDLGKLQVVGHTQRKEIRFNNQNNSLYIDTSVYTGNKLSAVVIENNNIIETISVPTISEDID